MPHGCQHDDVIKWNIFGVTGHLCGEFTGPRWKPLTKASDAELWCFLWSTPWINGWVNNRKAGDLRRHRAYYDVSVMYGMNVNSFQLPQDKRHEDISKWKHFPRYWSFVRGIHRSLMNSPHKGQWRGALMFSLALTNGWVKSREAGDLRRHRTHYDVTVIV